MALCVTGRRVSWGALCLAVEGDVVPAAVLAVLAVEVAGFPAVGGFASVVVVMIAPVLLVWRRCLV